MIEKLLRLLSNAIAESDDAAFARKLAGVHQIVKETLGHDGLAQLLRDRTHPVSKEWRRARKRLKTFSRVEGTSWPACACGHHKEWHHNQLFCGKCSCVHYSPTAEPSVRGSAAVRRGQARETRPAADRELWERLWENDHETTMAIIKARQQESARRRGRSERQSIDPWAPAIERAREQSKPKEPTSISDEEWWSKFKW